MSERAVDPARSRIVLVGPAYYDDLRLPDVPVIANNISDLAQVLTDERLGGFSPFHCISVPSAAGVAQVGDVLVRAADEAEDLLLFYYSGHGLLGPRRRELYLSLALTRPDQLAFTALPFEAIRDACLDSRATNRVVILDSCFSGRAIETLAPVNETVLGELDVSGTYTLTSSPANRTALVLPGERHTAFTERLLALLSVGSPAAGAMISLGDIYRHLHTQLRAEGLPVPQRRGVNNADLLGLVRNVHSAPLSGDAPAAADTVEPEGVSGTDMAERLVQAEGIANTISDALWRTRALARVVLAAASTFEPERTGRLINQAERAARMDGHTPAKALAAVATAVATFDPDRAERIASTITHMPTREDVLATVAKAVAATDPDRAEHIANDITVKYRRLRALSAVAAAVAATDPDRAEHIASTIADNYYRWPALSAVAAAVAATDPDRAERIANDMTRKYNRWPAVFSMEPAVAARLAAALGTVVAAVAAEDSDRAERIARATPHKSTRENVLATVAKAVAATDPDRAERIANTLIDEYVQVTVLTALASAVAAEDPERAGSLIDEAERIATTGGLSSRTEALIAVVTAADSFAPDRAERIAYAISHKSTKESVLVALGKVVAADDPDRAERIANTLIDEHSVVWVRAAVARAVAVADPDRARRIAQRVHGAVKAEILYSIVHVLTDPTR
ncbi:caspase family protein [Streptomyces sp. NBC_01764]|uniref:caspase family protein n=1 Tax=Streptomyces sp. NBC_01764 TaxID=2975935 RepID=UPI00225843B2|nr:caspase family protein [Streptomyces sp. NBC_01764]MCX4411509.1 caspase family protein [Streptomyces sp. NBC_01764]